MAIICEKIAETGNKNEKTYWKIGWFRKLLQAVRRHNRQCCDQPVELLAVLVPLDAVDGHDAGVATLELRPAPVQPVQRQPHPHHLHRAVVRQRVQPWQLQFRNVCANWTTSVWLEEFEGLSPSFQHVLILTLSIEYYRIDVIQPRRTNWAWLKPIDVAAKVWADFKDLERYR